MFVIVPEAMEKESPKAEEPLPELAIVDYPRSTLRLYWLYAYYLSWGEEPLPFLDKRSVLTFPVWKRRAFVHFTNLYYARWMHQHAGSKLDWELPYRGNSALCDACRNKHNCKELCTPVIERQKSGYITELRASINSFLRRLKTSNVQEELSYSRLPRIAFDVLFGEDVIGRKPPLVSRKLPPLTPIPEDQEEDDEWQ
jgi:hypothetical protein